MFVNNLINVKYNVGHPSLNLPILIERKGIHGLREYYVDLFIY